VRRYAEGTAVAVGKSRGEIVDLLHRRGCDKLGWAEELDEGRAVLQFVWSHGGQKYLARFGISMPKDAELEAQAIDQRTKKPSAAKLEKLRSARGRAEHRQLVLWLRACFAAVDAGIIQPEQVFLPWLVGRDGRTVWETAQSRLPELLVRNAGALLLGAGAEAS
jgi:hypothetical protein